MVLNVNNYSGPAGIRLKIPTHVSPPGGQATHPSVIKFDTPWNGYYYWMGVTPYPSSNDAHEDPNIVASPDGVNWEVPPGLTNPLDDQPGSPGAYNSDTFLVYRSDNNTLYCFWRTLDRSLASNQEKLYYRSSTNGTTWTAKALVMQVTTPAKSQLLSPTLRWTGSNWQMWVVNDVASPNTLVRYVSTGSTPTSWGAPTTCSVDNRAASEDLWHVLITPLAGGELIGVATLNQFDVSGYPTWNKLIHSTDGLTWTLSDNEIVPRASEWSTSVYAGSVVPVYDSWGNVDFDIWYKGMLPGPPSINNILYSRLTHINDVVPPTAPGIPTGTPLLGGGVRVSWTPATDDVGVAAYRVERGGVIVGTVSGTDTTFDDLSLPLGASGSYRIQASDAAGNATWGGAAVLTAAPAPVAIPPDNSTPGDAIEVTIWGDGAFAGQSAAVADYTISEDATPLGVIDATAGIGDISFSVMEDDDPRSGSMLLKGQPFHIYDPDAGSQLGVIDNVSSRDGMMNVTGFTLGYSMVAERSAAPYVGSLAGAFLYYLALGGVTDNIRLADDLHLTQVALPPWRGEVWERVRTLAAIHGLEVGIVAGTVTVRYIRGRSIDFRNPESISLEFGSGEAAQAVVVEYREKQWAAGAVVYPPADQSILDYNIYSVDAGELLETNIKVNCYLYTVEQPTHVNSVPPGTPLTSIYTVIDKDNQPVSPFDWANSGGYLSVAIGEDGESIDLTIRGSYTQSRAPFRIAASSSDGEYQYGSLSIRATGVMFEDKAVSSLTGADAALAPADSEIRISEPLISTAAEANAALAHAVQRRSGHRAFINVTARTVNRRGSLGNILGPTFGEFEAEYPTMTFGQFETEFAGLTFGDFDDLMTQDYRGEFENQAYGGIGGARVRYRDAMYRVVSASGGPGGFNWRAESDTTFGDFEAEMPSGMTFGDFEALWPDQTFDAFDLSPLVN